MKCRIHRASDIERLLTHVPNIDEEPRVQDAVEKYLYRYAEPKLAVSMTSFARLIRTGEIVGHIGANLISNAKADHIEACRDKMTTYDLEILEPLTESELRTANRTDGSTLFLTSFFWSKCEISAEIQFARRALDRMVRWFEGNRIQSIMFTVQDDRKNLVDSVIEAMQEEMYRIHRLDGNVHLYRVSSPWRPRGMSVPWVERLFQSYPQPNATLSDDLKLRGRIFHEYGFDISAARQGCIPEWTSDTSYFKWRTDAANKLGFNTTGNRGIESTAKIQALFEQNPRTLTLY